jgi:hypothetical protein
VLVRYCGPAAAVVIAATGQRVARGETVEVDAELGAALVRQAAWSAADETPLDPAAPTDPTPSKPRRPRRTSTEES